MHRSAPPVSNSSIARLRDTLRPTPTAGVVQNTAVLSPGSAKLALSDATARSHIDTSWQPAAVAMPCTRAIVGCGNCVSFIIIALQRSNSIRCQPMSRCARISFRSWPAEKPLPLAAITTTRTSLSAPAASSSAASASIIASDSGL